MSSNYWDRVYEDQPGYYGSADAPSLIEITKYISKGDTVLDCGCGIGTLKKLLPDNEYMGFDYSPRAVRIAVKTHTTSVFMAADARQMDKLFKDNEFDVVVLRHFLENQEDWKETIRQAFRVANKKVIIVVRGGFGRSTILQEQKEDTFKWEIDQADFNEVARSLSVNVSYGIVKDLVIDDGIVIIGKHLDKCVFDLDDFHNNNHNLPMLLEAKAKWPKLKVTLFCIPALCTKEFIQDCKNKYGDWMQFAVHGFYHDVDGRIAQECNYWTKEDANKYLQMAEDMGVFIKGFRPPGWCINHETYEVLRDRGYWVADHRGHDRWENEILLPRYTTGNLAEMHGHIQNVNGNGLEELLKYKCNFGDNSEFYFISEVLDTDWYLPNAYQ